jgi:hypothetical protein
MRDMIELLKRILQKIHKIILTFFFVNAIFFYKFVQPFGNFLETRRWYVVHLKIFFIKDGDSKEIFDPFEDSRDTLVKCF